MTSQFLPRLSAKKVSSVFLIPPEDLVFMSQMQHRSGFLDVLDFGSAGKGVCIALEHERAVALLCSKGSVDPTEAIQVAEPST